MTVLSHFRFSRLYERSRLYPEYAAAVASNNMRASLERVIRSILPFVSSANKIREGVQQCVVGESIRASSPAVGACVSCTESVCDRV